jgi:lipoprotein-anchoring transpeptidase ErfK/SrfK
MQPFTSEEKLTVTMKDGEVFTIQVTDAQISANVLTADGRTYKITVTFDDDAKIPAGTKLVANENGFGTDDYRVKYATRIKGGYYYHSVLYDPTGSYLIDGRLGMALSHGCVRLDTDNAEWIYINIPDTTAVLIH